MCNFYFVEKNMVANFVLLFVCTFGVLSTVNSASFQNCRKVKGGSLFVNHFSD